MDINDDFEFLFDRERYESYHEKEEELSICQRMMIAEEMGWLDLVMNFQKKKLEKERAELEQRIKDLGLD
ncbi:MAG: hypothetical protein N4A35_15150 [Flavobacteriales bacterium]|jgi:hypothetical protein|nr:hypothetical protein [Flavobacteriales bacterium]